MTETKTSNVNIEKRRKQVEAVSTVGLILLAAGLVAPFVSLENETLAAVFKWIFAAGALIYTVARMINVSSPGESSRLRRLRRLEMWAGFAFCAGAFFWFYNAARLNIPVLTLGVLNDTIMFTLAGAVIQIIASWMISAQARKDAAAKGADRKEKKKKGE